MHDIKYLFLNKNNQTIQLGGGKKKFRRGKLPKALPKNIIFQNSGGHVTLLDLLESAPDY
jgi:hypothetical protein